MDKSIFSEIGKWVEQIDELVWGPWMLALLLGTGGYLMVKMHFVPLKNLRFALLCSIGREGKKHGADSKDSAKGISSFSSLTTELAATIGVGNIVGVSTAMVLGGPGALLWMMISSLFGLSTKLVESMLSVKYRTRNEYGEYVGGPMYTMVSGLPHKRLGKLLGVFFALFAVMASFGMGNMTQSNAIAEAVKTAFGIQEHQTGLVVTIATILVVLGGIGTIARVTQVLVPVMGTVYMLGTLLVIMTHFENVPGGIVEIVEMAFWPQAMCGGVCGQLCVSVSEAMRWGISRGVFSNEAGLGVSGISAAAAETDDYIKQGYISMTGVFLDTMVICSATGLAIAASGMLGTTDERGNILTGTTLVIEVFRTALGEFGAAFVSICIVLFAFATIVGWAYQGEKAFEFLVGSRFCMCYRFFYALITYVGTVCTLKLVWDFSDICNALMAIPNLICLLWMSNKSCEEILAYDKTRSDRSS